jgi:hypothetical protein
MRAIRAGILTLGVLAVAAVPARAQVAPVDGGTNIGGFVDSYMELSLTQPSGLSKFKKAGTYSTSFTASATATLEGTQLSLADGEVASGSKVGFMAAGSKRLKDPLEARVGSAAFQPLDASVDPLLMRWSKILAHEDAKVTLRQKVRGKPSTKAYRKVLWATLSSEMP